MKDVSFMKSWLLLVLPCSTTVAKGSANLDIHGVGDASADLFDVKIIDGISRTSEYHIYDKSYKSVDSSTAMTEGSVIKSRSFKNRTVKVM